MFTQVLAMTMVKAQSVIMNDPFFIAIAALLLIVLLLFLFLRNKTDRQQLENRLHKDYRRPTHHHGDADTDVRDENN